MSLEESTTSPSSECSLPPFQPLRSNPGQRACRLKYVTQDVLKEAQTFLDSLRTGRGCFSSLSPNSPRLHPTSEQQRSILTLLTHSDHRPSGRVKWITVNHAGNLICDICHVLTPTKPSYFSHQTLFDHICFFCPGCDQIFYDHISLMIHFKNKRACDDEAEKRLTAGWDMFANKALLFAVDMHSAVEYLVRKAADYEAKEFFMNHVVQPERPDASRLSSVTPSPVLSVQRSERYSPGFKMEPNPHKCKSLPIGGTLIWETMAHKPILCPILLELTTPDMHSLI